MAWLALFAAVFFEVLAFIQMKLSKGFTRLEASIIASLFFALSCVCISIALQDIDQEIAYSVLTWLGMLGLISIEVSDLRI